LDDFETDFAPLFDPPLQSVERVPNLDVETFHRQYREARVPVIIEGETDDWPALRRWSDPEYLKRTVGNVPTYVRDLENGSISGAGYREAYQRVPFCELVDQITAPTPRKLYLTQGILRRPTGLLQAFERTAYPAVLTALSEDVTVPRYWKPQEMLQTNLWFGPGEHASALHFDEYDNLNAVITGSKRWLLFPASEVGKLTAGHSDARRSIVRGYHAAEPERFEPIARRGVRGYQCVAGPGELLYVPVGTWHQVFSGPGLSMAVNFWFLRVPQDALRVATYTARRFSGFRSRKRFALAMGAVSAEVGRRLGSYAVQRVLGRERPPPRVGRTSYL
jgi:hypothetical protein